MSKSENFDDFLRSKFLETQPEIEDNGFTERVLSGLPAKKALRVKKNFILYSVGSLSAIIFLISGGMKGLIMSILNVSRDAFQLTLPTFASVLVILAFICIPFVIARMEWDESIV